MRSWVSLVILLSLSTFQCASLPFLDLAYSLLTFYLTEIISLCTLFIFITASLSSFAQRRGVVCLMFCVLYLLALETSIFTAVTIHVCIRASNYIDIDGNKQHINDQCCLRAACQIEDSVWLGQEQSGKSEKWMAHQTVTVEIPKLSSTVREVVLRTTFDSVPGIQMHNY